MRKQGSSMSMDMTGMCNINLLYFFAAVLVCLFVTEDFKSGYVIGCLAGGILFSAGFGATSNLALKKTSLV